MNSSANDVSTFDVDGTMMRHTSIKVVLERLR